MRTVLKYCASEHTPLLSLPCLENISKWYCQGKASFTFFLGSFPKLSEAFNRLRSYWSGSGARSLVICRNRYNKEYVLQKKLTFSYTLGFNEEFLLMNSLNEKCGIESAWGELPSCLLHQKTKSVLFVLPELHFI